MRDVFISYARSDRDHAAVLASSLEGSGVSVWWDREIPPGRTFDEVIEEALTVARCVLVLWSENSIQSRWVRAEASAAADRGILVPVLVESVEPPLEFRNIQAADLTAWHGDHDDPELQKLLATVSAMVGKAAVSPVPPIRRSTSRYLPAAFQKLAIALISLVAGVGLAYLLLSPRASDSTQGSAATGTTEEATSAVASPNEPASGSQPSGSRAQSRGAIAESGRIDLLARDNWWPSGARPS